MLPQRLPRKSDKADKGKRCVACDSPLTRRPGEKARKWNRRETCGKSCAMAVRPTWTTAHEMLIHETVVSKLTGCWEWQRHRNAGGYGQCSGIDGETLAHRVAYAERHGPIPAGMHVLHKCDNPPCCNVEHLFLGTNLDNVIDRQRKGRTASGAKHGAYKHGKYVGRKPPATVQIYWDWLQLEHSLCVCGAPTEHIHHIMHVNRQRITKDHWLVIPLCHACHNGSDVSVHALGGERQFYEKTGHDLVQRAVLNRHNYEAGGGRR